MDDKIEKLRMDRLDKKTPTYDEVHMLGVYKVLNAEQAAGKFKQSAGKARQAKNAANKDIGIESRKSSPVKKAGGMGSSRGGALSKKVRETTALGGEMMATGTKQPTQQ